MLDRIHQTAKAVSDKTGATVCIQFYTGGSNSINMQIYPAGWLDAREKVDNGTASLDDWNLSRSAKHYDRIPPGSKGQAEIMEILEEML